MKLIAQIINDLIDSDKSLTSPILKTKVLASKLKNQELLFWVNNEFSGYSNTDSLPKYRIVAAQLKGVYKNGYQVYNNAPLVASVLPSKLAEYMNKAKLNMSVESLESYLDADKSGVLEENLPAEICSMITKGYERMGNHFFEVISAYKEFPKTAIVQVLSEIRSKLLDLMLEIDDKYGNTDLDDLIIQKTKVNELIIQSMNNNIITGDANILNTGNDNKLSTKSIISKGKIDDLKKILKENNVSDEDIDEIIEIVQNEEPDFGNKKVGNRASEWMKKMIGKSIDGSWQIGVGAAGDLVANLVGNYYGL